MAISDVPESARPISRTLFQLVQGGVHLGLHLFPGFLTLLLQLLILTRRRLVLLGQFLQLFSQFSARLICLGFLSRLKSRDLPAEFVKLRLDSLLVLFPGLGSRPSLLLGLLCRHMLGPMVRHRSKQRYRQHRGGTLCSGSHVPLPPEYKTSLATLPIRAFRHTPTQSLANWVSVFHQSLPFM